MFFRTLAPWWRWLKFSLVAGALALVFGCSSRPETLPEPDVIEQSPEMVDEVPVPAPEPEVVTYGLGDSEDIVVLDDPWDLVEQAETASPNEVPDLLLRAMNEFIDRGDIQAASSLATRLDSYPLIVDERFALNIAKARILVATNRHAEALQQLAATPFGQVRDPALQADYLEAQAAAQGALGRLPDAVSTRLLLDASLAGPDRTLNQRALIDLLQQMDPLHVVILRENVSNPDLEGWIALADVMIHTDPVVVEVGVTQWRATYPYHPVQEEIIDSRSGSIEIAQYRQIALLLPLTSPFASAAQAFHDGFMEGYEHDPSFQRPLILTYDVGEEASLSALYYQAAMNDGADFIVGPLGRNAVESLLASRQADVSTMVIADVPEERSAENLFSISLSPESEAVQAARKAFADGHRQATVFRIEGEWGNRVANAFISEWEAQGGVIVRNSSFPRDIDDYTRIIQKYLGLDKSIARHKIVQAKAGVQLKFTPRRNHDIDLIFLAANAAQARLVVPQLKFFQAHDLPMYGTSYVYSGAPEPGVDADLDGLVFGDMKWMLEGVELYRARIAEEEALRAAEEAEAEAARLAAEEAALQEENLGFETSSEAEDVASENAEPDIAEDGDGSLIALASADQGELTGDEEGDGLELGNLGEEEKTLDRPYQGTNLDRLFALGLQSYEAIPRLASMRTNPWARYAGTAMTISVDEWGQVVRHPMWSHFKSGLPQPIYEIDRRSIAIAPAE